MICASRFRDCNNFKNSIENDQTPPQSSIQYDGFFNSYFFPLGVQQVDKTGEELITRKKQKALEALFPTLLAETL